MKEKVEIPISELYYYIFFSLLFFAKGIGLYDGQDIFKICLVVACGFVLCKFSLTEYSVKEIIFVGLLLLLGIHIYYHSGEKSALIYIFLMLGLKNVPIERIMKLGLIIWSASFGGLIVKSMLGIGNDIVMAHEKFGIAILRRGLGYSHPNVLHVSYAVLVVLILYTIQDIKKKKAAYVMTFIGNICVFLYSASYTGFMLVVFCILFELYFTYRPTPGKAEKVLIQLIFPFCVLFSLFAPILVNTDGFLFKILNKALNQRFYASRLYLQENPLTLFGQKIYASHTYALDSSYVTLFIYGGLVLFLLMCFAYIMTIAGNVKNGNGKALSVLLSFAVAGVIEPFLFNFSFKNLSLLFIGYYLFESMSLPVKNEKWRFFDIKVKLLSGWNRKLTFSRLLEQQTIDYIKNLQPHIKKRIIGISVAGAILFGSMFYFMADMPAIAYVGEEYCNINSQPVYVNRADYADDGNTVFYEYVDEQHGVYMFSGATMVYERVRDSIRAGVVTGGILYGGFLLYLYCKRKNKGQVNEQNSKLN